MPFLAGSAISTLGLDANPFRTGMLQSQSMMQMFPGWVTNFMASPLLGFAGIAQSALSMVRQAFLESLGRADEIHDTALMVGTSAEELSGYGFAAEQANSSTQALATGLRFLNDNMKDAARDNKAMAAEFKEAGVVFEDTQGRLRPAVQVMLDLADAIAKTDDAGDRTKWAQLMGKAGAELIPMLRGGRAEIEQAREASDALGRTITTRAAASADAFGDLMGEVKAAREGIQNALAEPIRDELTPILAGWVDWTKSNSSQIRTELRTVVSVAADTATAITALFKVVRAAWDYSVGPMLESLGEASDAVAQMTMGNRSGVNSVSALRTREEALRDRVSTRPQTVNVQIKDDRASAGEVTEAVLRGLRENRSAIQRAEIDQKRRIREAGL